MNPSGIHPLPDDDDSNAFVSSEWVRRNVVGVMKGYSTTSSGNPNKVATLVSSFMDPVVFKRQIGSTVAITFDRKDETRSALTTTLNVNNTGAATIIFGGETLKPGMIGSKFTHMFVFDGENWRLINPVPGTGTPEIIIKPPTPPGPDDDGEIVINRQSGHMGVTTEGDGISDSNGQVLRAYIVINFTPRATDVLVTVSDHEDCWGLQMGDGTIIACNDPKIIQTTRSNAVLQVSLDSFYPSNSPCQLIFRTNKAWISIKEI